MIKSNLLCCFVLCIALSVCCISCSKSEDIQDSDFSSAGQEFIVSDEKSQSEEMFQSNEATQNDDGLSGNILFSDIQEYFRIESVKAGDKYEFICSDGHIINGTFVTQADYTLSEYLQRLDYIRVEFPGNPVPELLRIHGYRKDGEEIILAFSRHTLYIVDKEGKHLAEFMFGDRTVDIELMMSILFRSEQLDEYVKHFDNYSNIIEENQALRTWKGYCFDSDGDGDTENIFVAYCGEPWHNEWSFDNPHVLQGDYVSGVNIYVNGKLCVENRYSFAPLTNHVGLVKVPGDDTHMYLTAFEFGGDIMETTFYRFENDSVSFAFTDENDFFEYAPVYYKHGVFREVVGINNAQTEKLMGSN